MTKSPSFETQFRNKMFRTSYKLSEVSNRIEKVAADIVKFKDDDNDAHLWEVQSSDDGAYIVALYDVQEIEKTASHNPWKIDVNESEKVIDVYYEDLFLKRFAAKELPFSESEFSLSKKFFAKSLATNEKLSKSLIKLLPESIKIKLAAKYPVLNKHIGQ